MDLDLLFDVVIAIIAGVFVAVIGSLAMGALQ